MSTRTWLVAYDFSDHGKLALDRARAQLAGLGGGKLVLAYVYPPASDGVGIDLGAIGPGFVEHEQTMMKTATDDLTHVIAAQPQSEGAPIAYEQRVVTGRIADRLVEIAHEVGAEQIVIGSHGRRGFERFLLGSVAERVLRLADCTVLVVKK